MEKHIVVEANAEKIFGWLKNRGGLAIWKSINLSNPGASWTTPALTEDGKPYPKSNWQMANEPVRKITDIDEVVISLPKEVKRFHVAVRRGDQGLTFKLTDGSTRRLKSALARIKEQTGKDTFYEFDYSMQEAVIFVDDRLIPLKEYAESKGWN